jgi:hypothetical protein
MASFVAWRNISNGPRKPRFSRHFENENSFEVRILSDGRVIVFLRI